MQLKTIITSASFAMGFAPVGVLAWAQGPGGVWVANNKVYPRVGNYNNVHESCTTMNTANVHTSGDCAYWIDGNGNVEGGQCVVRENSVNCERGCPDSTSVCQYVEDDGTCSYGYYACIQKTGCGNDGLGCPGCRICD